MVMYDESDSEFISPREGNKPYVDKSGFIADVLRMGKKACLINRPRRFGKSMNLSMMDAYPVVVIDFTLTNSRDRGSFEGSLGVLMSNVYDSFPELKDSERLGEAMRSRYRRMVFLRPDLDEWFGFTEEEVSAIFSDGDGEGLSERALNQMKERNYSHGMTGRTLIYGFALGGREPAVKKGELNLPPCEE